jgi:hypothetical protein
MKSKREQEELHAQVSQLGIEIESYFFRALRECPDYSDGWNNLGVYYFNVSLLTFFHSLLHRSLLAY